MAIYRRIFQPRFFVIVGLIINSRFLQRPQIEVARTSLFAGAYPKQKR